MLISLIDAGETGRRLRALIKKHDRISIAVAWAGVMPVAETLLENTTKFESVLLGVDFSATDPALIERLVDVPNAFVARNRIGCFHPKIFYFQTRDLAEAIIGSSNFTQGGLGPNFEANVCVKGAVDEPFFQQVRNQLERYEHLKLKITGPLAASYRRQSKAASNRPRPKNPVLSDEIQDWARVNSPLGIMSWTEFVRLARQDLYHDFAKRMKLVRAIQQIFFKALSFANLTTAEAKGIAGVLGKADAESAKIHELDWGWFGSMGGAGTFASLIGKMDNKLAAALDAIPKRGDVSEAQFNNYVTAFAAAFLRQPRTAGLGPATRLLAMKRPDLFVCVNNRNKGGLAAALAFAPSTINLKNYWRRVIEPIRQAPWYNAPRPVGRNADLWDARVAMLDAIYYRPDSK